MYCHKYPACRGRSQDPRVRRLQRHQRQEALPALEWVSHPPLPASPLPSFCCILSNSSCPLPGYRGPAAHPQSDHSHRTMSSLPGCQCWRLPSALPKQVSLVPCSPSGLMKATKQNLGCMGRVVMPRGAWKLFHAFSSFSLPSFCFLLSCLSYFLHNFLFSTQSNFSHVVHP